VNVGEQTEEAIFKAAIELESPAERVAYVRQACGSDAALRARLDVLLQAHDEVGNFLETPPLDLDTALQIPPVNEGPGTVIGRYKLLEKIGEGGMAVVYMAEQREPIRRTVALKIIKLGMDTKQVIARFEAERQALAMMDHTNIAKVFDGGATEAGRPFFVMELVRGIAITRYCDENRLGTRERLALFLQVCQAVQHAHQKGVIHRDIKPSNILVTKQDGEAIPKVIDFGIAKATDQRLTEKTLFTRYAQIIGTPAYMSPEQAEFGDTDTDTRTDIYSLGVLLYELLTGATPFSEEELRKAGYLEMQRVIREEEPTKPSTRLTTLGETVTNIAQLRTSTPDLLRRILRGDLDWIVMKSLEKDRKRRYDTASILLEDIKRYLNHEPVSAGPPSARYRTKKFVQRHRTLVTATTAVIAAIVTSLIVSIAMYVQAERANAETQAVSDFLRNDLLATVQPENARGREATVRYILESASAKLEGKFVDSPLVEAEIRTTLGLTYQKMGNYPAAEPHLKWVLETRERVLGEQHPDTLQSMCDLAWQYIFQGRFDKAETPALRALEEGRRVLGREHPVVLSAMQCCGFMYVVGFQSKKAEPIVHEGYETSRRILGEEHEQTVGFMNLLAWLYDAEHRQEKALETAVRAFDVARRALGQKHPMTIQAMNQLGRAYTVEGRFDEAEVLLRESVEISRRVLGEGHLFTLFYTARLASVYRAQEQYEQMENITAEALRIARGIPGKLMVTGYLKWRLWQRVVALSAEARAQYDAGRYDEAVDALTRQERLRLSLNSHQNRPPPPNVAVLAMSLYRLGRDEEAQNTLQRLREMLESGEYTYQEQSLYEAEELFSGQENEVASVWNLLIEGRLEAASEYLEGPPPPAPENKRATSADAENIRRSLARAYCLRGCRAEGRGAYQDAIQDYEIAIRINPGCARAHNRLARLLAVCHLARWRDGVRSVEHATKACELTGWSNANFVSTLAAAHAEAGDFPTAAQLEGQAIRLLAEDEREQWLPDHEMRLRLYEAGRPYRWSLMAWWTFGQASNEMILDSSGNDLHGRPMGDAHVTKDAERPGQVLCLDGDGDWVDCGNNATLDIVSEITVACWMKATSNKYGAAILCSGDNAWLLDRYLASDHLEFSCVGVTISNSMSGSLIGQTDVNDNRWHHVAGVYDGTAMRLYIDGKLDISSEASGRIKGASSRVLIGENDVETTVYGRERSFQGLIDDVRIYNYAITEAEIMGLYAGREPQEQER